MAKRDAQSFLWTAKAGVLSIVGRKDGPMEGESRTYALASYPSEIREKITDAGFKAVFQQRTSQIETDEEKLTEWDSLDALFQAGDWEKEGGTRGAPVLAAWIEAAANFKHVTPGEFQASWSKLDKAQRDAVKATCERRFAIEIARIKAGRKDEVDLSDLA